MDKPWGGMNPNSTHQLWAHWTFVVDEGPRTVPPKDVEVNALRFMRALFGSVGRARIRRTVSFNSSAYIIEVQTEGVPAHDPKLVESVRKQFQKNFVDKGWGPLARCGVNVRVLAGSKQDGKPAAQLIVLPSMVETEKP